MTTVYTIPPPTTNRLEPTQRRQLLKSAQKLGALLGTTPRLVEPEFDPPPPLTPGTRAFRREGKVFYQHSTSSSQTSLSSSETDNYVWVPSPTRMKQHEENPSSPISVKFPHDTAALTNVAQQKSKPSHRRKTTAPHQLSQPLIYRLRSRPSPPRTMCPNLSNENVASLSPLPSASQPQSSPTRGGADLSNSDRRRKIAKLTRTFGEVVPPELVLGPPPRSSSLASKSTATPSSTIVGTAPLSLTPSRRKRSATGGQGPTEPVSQQVSTAPPAPAISTEIPNEASIDANINLSSAPKLPPQSPVVTVTTTTIPATAQRSGHRPRTLSLTNIPVVLHRGIREQDQLPRPIGHQPSRSLDESDRATAARCEVSMTTVEYGYRKERDWSGEWNVKDIGDVVDALRALRVG